MIPRRKICVNALCLAALLASTAFAAGVDAKKGELQDLKGRIEALQRDMAAAEESKTSAADQLRETESAISNTNRRLHELAAERAGLKVQLDELLAQSQRLDRQTGAQQNQLARLLNRQFVGGDADALKLLLSGRDPNQSARDKYFLTQLSRAKADLINQLRAVAAEKKRLTDAAQARQAQLAEIERRQQESRAQLLDRKKQRLTKLIAIADRLKAQRREINTLKRDEQRLAKLIDGLARIAASKRARPKVGAGGTAVARAPKLKNHDPGNVGGAFAALRGQLRLPVKGVIDGRFGSPRPEGGAAWKGLFIRAAEGVEVKAVASGAVVFSDWLRGFGNLLIIDHGDDFLSVYGNNESLLAAVGASVKSGEPVATVGNSGGNPDSGLYFELRYRGQPFDPLKWADKR
ncbi:murein hydrolase activator EnvC family protein [Sulfuritalea sp.]|uniref:murein hydrolase activator EnvC family protein n=1 Tax=Sulfuritalea sp. TaxID=2480090 RepID=UPI00286E3AD6|nr:peptidoglycan DD-metalloendopeptidase family protein [Sulfuritalea sp.]